MNKSKSDGKTAKYIVSLFLAICISLLFIAGLVKVCCLCFNWEFSWKVSVGVWIATEVLYSVFHRDDKNDSE